MKLLPRTPPRLPFDATMITVDCSRGFNYAHGRVIQHWTNKKNQPSLHSFPWYINMSNTQIHLLHLILPTDTQRSSSSEVLEEAIGGSETIHLLVVPRTGTRTPQQGCFQLFLISEAYISAHCSAFSILANRKRKSIVWINALLT